MLQPCRLPNGFPATATFLVMAAFVPALASAGSVGFTNGGFEDGDGEGVGDLLAVGVEGPGLTGVAADTQADGRGCREKTGQRGVSADFVNVHWFTFS